MTELVDQLSYRELVLLCGAFFAVLIAFSCAIGFGLEFWLGATRRIWDLPRANGQLRWEFIGNLRFIAMAAFSFAGLLWFVPFAEESASTVLTTFLFCWTIFEIYYWALHRAMHWRPLYRFHRYHHDSRVTSPLTGYSMSGVESAGWLVGLVGTPLLLSLMTPISLLGLVLYHTIYQVAGNVVGHANVDFFPAAASKRANSWLTHPTTYHALHHARYNNHYGFGSSFMDRLMGTEWSDWPELHAQVVGGNALTKLSVRGTPEVLT